MEIGMTVYVSSTCTIQMIVKGTPKLKDKPPDTRMESWEDLALVESMAILLPGAGGSEPPLNLSLIHI